MRAITRECDRYGLNLPDVIEAYEGREPHTSQKRPWWDILIVAAAIAIFVWLASQVHRPPIAMNSTAAVVLSLVLAVLFVGCGWMLWKRTRFS